MSVFANAAKNRITYLHDSSTFIQDQHPRIMKVKLFLLIGIFLLVNFCTRATITMEKFGFGGSVYWIIYDTESRPTNNLVVFLHGYGASNPGCYGGWIRHIVENGNIVLFPKFQYGLWIPATGKYERRVDWTIGKAYDKIKEQTGIDIQKLTFVSHSLGGIIAANLSDAYGRTKERKVGGLVLIQPGFQLLPLGRQDTYSFIDPKVQVQLITSPEDHVAGKKFARHFFNETLQIPKQNKNHCVQSVKEISDHAGPVSPDWDLHGGNLNAVIIAAYLFGNQKDDLVDFWALSDALIAKVNDSLVSIEVK